MNYLKEEKQEQQTEDMKNENTVVLTLYTCRKNADNVPEIAQRLFGEMMEQIVLEEKGFQIQLQDGSVIRFSVLINQPENRVQSEGMANFFSAAPMKNEQVKEAALTQIRLFNCIIGIVFEMDEIEQRTNYVIHTIYEMADEIGAFILYPDMHLYNSNGELLISIDGETDFEEFYPEASADILNRQAEEMEEDRKRKERSIAILKQLKIPYMESLTAAVYESECHLFDKEDIIHRLTAIFAASVQAEIYTSGKWEDPSEKTEQVLEELEERYEIFKWMSLEEKAYIENPLQNPTLHNKFGWRYECCLVLLWALSLIELKKPTEICDASELGKIIWNHTFDTLKEKAVLRSWKEILDMQDLVFRYDWACVDARIHHHDLPNLNGEIVYEWHYALNWLVRADGISEWDDVTPTT